MTTTMIETTHDADALATYLASIASIETVIAGATVDATVEARLSEAQRLAEAAKSEKEKAAEADKAGMDLRITGAIATSLLITSKKETGKSIHEKTGYSQAYVSAIKMAGDIMLQSDKCLALKDGEPTRAALSARRKVWAWATGNVKRNAAQRDAILAAEGDPVDAIGASLEEEKEARKAEAPTPAETLLKKAEEFLARFEKVAESDPEGARAAADYLLAGLTINA